MRQTLERHLEGVSQRATSAAQAEHGGIIMVNATPYRVDGELGRVAFPTFALRDGGTVIWNSTAELFGAQGPREYHYTAGMRQLMLRLTSAMSYRDTTDILNRVRHTADHPTPVTTLAAMVEREGTAVQGWIDHWTTTTLADHAFTEEGTPSAEHPIQPLAADQGRLRQSVIDQALAHYNAGKPAEQKIPLTAAQDFYEDPNTVVTISIDDVSVKKQKPHRDHAPAPAAGPAAESAETPPTVPTPPVDEAVTPDPGAETAPVAQSTKKRRTPKPAKAELKRVHNTIAQIDNPQGRYILSGSHPAAVLRILIAFLLRQDLFRTRRIQFFADGARDLHAAIHTLLDWVPSLRILLDWYHLEKKCGELLRSALRGKAVRNEVLPALLGLLWLGRVDAAIAYLQQLSAGAIKDRSWLDKLMNYLERHREEIPCYALRQALGLRNSSNRGEKANDLCVADRQKHRGMSWSPEGSQALTSTTTVGRNHELEQWCENGELTLQWVA